MNTTTSIITEFPQSVIEQIGYYVYSLTDPRTGKIFYVGKGTGNRVFAHARDALDRPTRADKLDIIREIHASGLYVQYELIRHGLEEKEALEVEAALIDFIGLTDLTNRVAGQLTDRRGRMSITDVVATYRAEEVQIVEPAILIIVNRLFRRNMPPDELYEITRGDWVLGNRRNKAEYACSVYRGIVREVYRIERWENVEVTDDRSKRKHRWRFIGEIATDLRHYLGGSVRSYIKPGCQSPVLYVNC